MDDFVAIISNLGFPIACVIFMWYYMMKMTDAHKEEIDSVKDALNQNTLVLQKLVDKLDKVVE